MQRVLRIVPITGQTDLRGQATETVPCPTHWPDGQHAFHHCQYMIVRYTPVAPLKDGWVEDLHDGPHRCSCGATL